MAYHILEMPGIDKFVTFMDDLRVNSQIFPIFYILENY